jgi:hypothetical protein
VFFAVLTGQSPMGLPHEVPSVQNTDESGAKRPCYSPTPEEANFFQRVAVASLHD